MFRRGAVLLCLAYILGLLLVPVPGANYGIVILGVIGAGVVPRCWRKSPPWGMWLLASVVGGLASVYFSWRLPEPPRVDFGRWRGEVVSVQGRVVSEPRLTRSQRLQFTLAATQIQDQSLEAKLYTTIPLLLGTGLHSGYSVEITGKVYTPQLATVPGGFDFSAYLARQGMFAGLSGEKVKFDGTGAAWGWWRIRQRIVRGLVQRLDVPHGVVVGSIVMGKSAVDLPFSLRDDFIQVGLAHVLAASGFHVSLLLGLMLGLTQGRSPKTQLGLGIGILIFYTGLTGYQPSVLRAALMGLAGLVGRELDRRVNTLGSLLLTATVLLAVNPLWIQDLGFQLSFLATLGLVVTVPVLMRRWDGLPPAIASTFAVPISALIWTLPLQLYQFGLVSPYCILVNAIATPFVTLVTLGGVVVSLISLISPHAGSLVAQGLYYPTEGLIQIVHGFSQLPGNSVAVGKISLIQLLLLYGIIGGFWLKGILSPLPPGKTPSPMPVVIALGFTWMLLMIPLWHRQHDRAQITIFPTKTPVIAIQHQGNVGLINTIDVKTAQYMLIPFFRSQGINQLDFALTGNSQNHSTQGWLRILEDLPIQRFAQIGEEAAGENLLKPRVIARKGSYEVVPLHQTISWESMRFQGLSVEPEGLEWEWNDQHWFVGNDSRWMDRVCQPPDRCQPEGKATVWVFPGKGFHRETIKRIPPAVAIALSTPLEADILSEFQAQGTQLFLSREDGTVQWHEKQGFQTTTPAASKKDLHF